MLMRFCVNVPVLSLQITLAAPSVSTAGRWRTSAFFLAMRCVAIASDSVTVGSKPSGTFATMMPIANTRFSQNDSPTVCPIRKNTAPSSVANSATSRDRRAISFSCGDRGRGFSEGWSAGTSAEDRLPSLLRDANNGTSCLVCKLLLSLIWESVFHRREHGPIPFPRTCHSGKQHYRDTALMKKIVAIILILFYLFAAGHDCPAGNKGASYTIHGASYQKLDNALKNTKELKALGYESYYKKVDIPGRGVWYRVYIGRFTDRDEALQVARKLTASRAID